MKIRIKDQHEDWDQGSTKRLGSKNQSILKLGLSDESWIWERRMKLRIRRREREEMMQQLKMRTMS